MSKHRLFDSYNGLHAFHPSYYVAEIIEDMGNNQAEFAMRMGTDAETVNQLVSGKCRLSNELAGKLSAVTGISMDVWLNLQREYDRKALEIKYERKRNRRKKNA